MESLSHDTKPQPEPLTQCVSYLLEECRMVLPGIQALFGFQLIAVFNKTFWEKLSPGEMRLHLVAVGCMAAAICLVLTPAGYHRQVEPRGVSEELLTLASRLLQAGMAALACGILLDLYLIARLITDSVAGGVMVAGAATAMFAGFWFLFPMRRRRARESVERTEGALQGQH